MSIIPIQKVVYDKNEFLKLINVDFKELYSSTNVLSEEESIEYFFQLYDNLFYSISKEGDTNSHEYIYNKEKEYLGIKNQEDIDVQALLQEITYLRKQLLISEESNLRLSEQVPYDSISEKEIKELTENTLLTSTQIMDIKEEQSILNNMLTEI